MKKNILIFYVLAFLQGLVFYSSVATLYRTSQGLTLYQMGVIDSFFALFMIVFEIPWGVLCDHIGYKKTIIFANVFYVLSKVVFFYSDSFFGFLLERLFLSLAIAGLSGSDSALLYLSCPKDQTSEVFGRKNMFETLGMVVASLSFTFVFQSDMKLAAFATIIPFALAFIFTWFLDDITEQKRTSKYDLKQFLAIILKNKPFLLFVIASTLLTETTHILTVFYNQLQYQRIGLPIQYYGILFLLLQCIGLGSGWLGNLEKRFSKHRLIQIVFLGVSIAIVGLIFSQDVFSTILLLLVIALGESLYMPLKSLVENENISEGYRSTILSYYSLFANILCIFTNYSFGCVASVSLSHVYLLSLSFCLIGFVLYHIYKRVS